MRIGANQRSLRWSCDDDVARFRAKEILWRKYDQCWHMHWKNDTTDDWEDTALLFSEEDS